MTNSVWGSFGANVPTREVFVTETFTTLRALTNPKSTANVTIAVDGGVTKGDGLGGIFYYDPNSVLADDSLLVIAPSTGVGRWIRRDIVPGYNIFRKNAVINGSMEIAQKGTNFPACIDNFRPLDCWKYRVSGTMVHTVSQDSDVPTIAQAGQLFTKSLRFNLTTSQANLAVPDFCFFTHRIEGYNFRALAQRPLTFSFWVKATLPGIYSGCTANSNNDQTFVFPFTINNANTWEKKIINIPASPVAGTWDYINGVGYQLVWNLAIGANYQTLAGNVNVWAASSLQAIPGTINGVQAGATDFRITGVQLEVGNVASEFERRSFQEELILCQRYYEKSWAQGTSILTPTASGFSRYAANANIPDGNFVGETVFKVVKRTQNSIITIYPYTTPANTGRISDGTGVDAAANSGSLLNVFDRCFSIRNNSGAPVVPVQGNVIHHWTAEADV